MKLIYFMGGLPRSGGNVLSAILNQNSKIHVTNSTGTPTFIESKMKDPDHMSDFKTAFYSGLHAEHINDNFEYIVNRSIDWNGIYSKIVEVESNPKLIFPIRPIKEIVASAIRNFERQPNNKFYKKIGALENKMELDEKCFEFFGIFIKYDVEQIMNVVRNHRECIHLVHYHELVVSPVTCLNKIYNYCGFPHSNKHYFTNIKPRIGGDDERFGIKNYSIVRPNLGANIIKTSDYFGKELEYFFDEFDRLHQELGLI